MSENQWTDEAQRPGVVAGYRAEMREGLEAGRLAVIVDRDGRTDIRTPTDEDIAEQRHILTAPDVMSWHLLDELLDIESERRVNQFMFGELLDGREGMRRIVNVRRVVACVDANGYVDTEDDCGPLALTVDGDDRGVWLNIDPSTEADDAAIEADFARQGWSEHQNETGRDFLSVPLTADQARRLGMMLLAHSEGQE
jgi:hypothetical protein